MLLRLFVYVSVKCYQIKFFENCQLFIHDVLISSDDNRVTLSNKFHFQNTKTNTKKVETLLKIKSTYSYFSSTRNGLPTSTVASTIGLESPFQPFKVTSPMAPPAVTSSLNPLLGLPSPFPFLSAHGLSSLSDPKAAKGPLPPGLPPGFPG